MKKRIFCVILAIVTAFSLVSLAACGNNDDQTKIVAIEYVSGLKTTYNKGETPSFKDLVIKVTYSDEKTAEVDYDEKSMKVELDTSKVGEGQTGKITYESKTCEFKYTVVEVIEYSDVAQPASIALLASKKETYLDKTAPYKVGDDNDFVYRPVLYLGDGSTAPTEGVKYGCKVEKVGENEQLTSVENNTEYSFNEDASSFKFNEAAIGGVYKLTVFPAADETLNVSLTVEVIDGYNVYNAIDLYAMDNRTTSQNKAYYEGVKAFKQEHGITVDANSIKAVVLHNDIEITPETIPQALIWGENDLAGLTDEQKEIAKGSLRDFVRIYERILGDNDRFTLVGNYYTINAEKVPYVVLESGKYHDPKTVVSHAEIFYLKGNSRTNALAANTSEQARFENLTVIGNSKRQDDVYSGGIINFKAESVTFDVYNNIGKALYIATFTQYNATGRGLTLEKCQYTDSYNCLLYSYGGVIDIKETTLKSAGGPVFIADHVGENGDDGRGEKNVKGWPSRVNVDEKSVLESKVAGQEGWFVSMGATSAVTLLHGLDATLRNASKINPLLPNKTILDYNSGLKDTSGNDIPVFNFVGVFKSSSAQAMTFNKISGSATIGAEGDKHVFDFDETVTAGMLNYVSGKGANVLQGKTPSGILAQSGNQNLTYKADGTIDDLSKTNNAQIFLDSGYLNLFMGSQSDSGYLGVLLGNYVNVK